MKIKSFSSENSINQINFWQTDYLSFIIIIMQFVTHINPRFVYFTISLSYIISRFLFVYSLMESQSGHHPGHHGHHGHHTSTLPHTIHSGGGNVQHQINLDTSHHQHQHHQSSKHQSETRHTSQTHQSNASHREQREASHHHHHHHHHVSTLSLSFFLCFNKDWWP